jgi:hypothetical protein
MALTMSSLSIPVRVRLALGCGLLAMGSACSYFDTTDGLAAPSGLAYPVRNLTYDIGLAATPAVPTCGGGKVDRYSVEPALPAGLTLDPATGVLSGTPTVLTVQAPYLVTAENARGRARVTLTLAVVAQPAITAQPFDQSVGVGQDATFQVSASDALPLTYQWHRNGSAIAGAVGASYTLAGATGPSYTCSGATLADNGAIFRAVVTDGHGLVTPSDGATLTVVAPPIFTLQPTDQTATQGLGATFTAQASGAGALSYQWLRNGSAIDGARSSTYTLAAAVPGDHGAGFQVRATDPFGGVTTSASASLTVLAAGTRITTWLSGVGDDVNEGLRTAPVATLAQAQSLTPAGGSIGLLDPARFGPLTITRGLVVDGADSPGLLAASAGGGLVVDAPSGATVILRNLEIDATGADSAPAATGVSFRGGGLLVLEHCTIHGFTDAGVDAALAGSGRLVLRDVHIIGGTVSVRLAGSGLEADLARCCLEGAQTGLDVQGGQARLDRTLVTQNRQAGVQASGGTVSVEHCTLAGNGVAVQAVAGTARLADNDLYDNAAAFAATGGSLVSAGTNRLAGSPAGSATLGSLTLQ